jgi:hypothetical protein
MPAAGSTMPCGEGASPAGKTRICPSTAGWIRTSTSRVSDPAASSRSGAGKSRACAGSSWASGETLSGTTTTDTPPGGGDWTGNSWPRPDR